MIIPTEARATIEALREGKTDAQFINDMWKRRNAEHPGRRKSRGKWPIVCGEQVPTNVTQIRKRKP